MKDIDRYHKWIDWSEEDRVYIGHCPDLITGIHGDDPVTLFADLCEVVREVIDYHKENGIPLPEPITRPMREVV